MMVYLIELAKSGRTPPRSRLLLSAGRVHLNARGFKGGIAFRLYFAKVTSEGNYKCFNNQLCLHTINEQKYSGF